MTKNDLLGAWRLISWTLTHPDGSKSYPLGENALGYILYTPEGIMSAQLSRQDRQAFASDEIFAATAEEVHQDYQQYASYCGTYSLENNQVTHHVEQCSFPNYHGIDLVRQVRLLEQQLILSHEFSGADSYLVWEKV